MDFKAFHSMAFWLPPSMCTHVCARTCTPTHRHTLSHKHPHSPTYTQTHAASHTHAHILTHLHTHIQTYTLSCTDPDTHTLTHSITCTPSTHTHIQTHTFAHPQHHTPSHTRICAQCTYITHVHPTHAFRTFAGVTSFLIWKCIATPVPGILLILKDPSQKWHPLSLPSPSVSLCFLNTLNILFLKYYNSSCISLFHVSFNR